MRRINKMNKRIVTHNRSRKNNKSKLMKKSITKRISKLINHLSTNNN